MNDVSRLNASLSKIHSFRTNLNANNLEYVYFSRTPLQQKRIPHQKQVKRLLKPVLRDSDRYGDSLSDGNSILILFNYSQQKD